MSKLIDVLKKLPGHLKYKNYINFYINEETANEMIELTKNINEKDLVKFGKLPFDQCFIQIQNFGFACLTVDSEIVLEMFQNNFNELIQINLEGKFSNSGFYMRNKDNSEISIEGKNEFFKRSSSLIRILYCMNCIDLTTAEKQDHSKINKKRAKKNKPLLTEHHVITLNLKHYESSGCKGDNTNRRPHLRRGHFRKLAEDRIIWVRNCAVGNVRKVNQEYKVKL